jgi:hypothetical protein
MKIYVVTMYRYGDHEKHSYVLGCWSNSFVAKMYGLTEESWRAGKYKHEITEWILDSNECDNILENGNTQ